MKKVLLFLTVILSVSGFAQTWIDVDQTFNFNPNDVSLNTQTIVTDDNQKFLVVHLDYALQTDETYLYKFNEHSKQYENVIAGVLDYDASNIESAVVGNKVYVGYQYNSDYKIIEYDGSDTNVIYNNPQVMSKTSFNLCANDNDLFFINSRNDDQRFLYIEKYDGTSWTNLLSNGLFNINGTNTESHSIATNSSIWYMTKSGASMSSSTDTTYLCQIDLASPSLVIHEGFSPNAGGFSMALSNNNYPYFGFKNDNTSSYSFYQTTASGSSLLKSEPLGSPLIGVRINSNSNGVYSSILEDEGPVRKIKLRQWNGSDWNLLTNGNPLTQNGGLGPTPSIPNFMVMENGRMIVNSFFPPSGGQWKSANEEGLQVRMSNESPNASSCLPTEHCLSSFNVVVCDNFVVTDTDMDSTYIFFNDQTDNPGYLDTTNMNISELAYDPNSDTRSFTITAQYFGGSGIVAVPIAFTDGFDTSYTSIQVTIHPQPTLPNPPPLDLCTNGDLYDLNQVFNDNTITWSGNAVTAGHYYDPLIIERNVPSDIISFTMTDANGCSETAELNINLLQYDTLNVTSSNSSCNANDGTASVTVAGSHGPYEYYWSTGESTTSVADLGPGVYYINVTHINGCIEVQQVNIQSSEIDLSVDLDAPTCFGDNDGSIDLSASGNGPFLFLWSTGDSTEDVSGLSAGPYFVTVTDANGCVSTANYELEQPDKLTFDPSTYPSSCTIDDGVASTWNHTGGSGNYTHWWSTGDLGFEIQLAAPGNYKYVLKDDEGCISDTAFLNVSTFNGPYLGLIAENTNCNGVDGAIDLIATENTSPIESYLWSNGETTEDISGLNAGTYSVEVTDTSGCKSFASATIEIIQPLQNNICIVTVDSNTTTNLVAWEKEELSGIDHYNIYREDGEVGNYIKIDEVAFDEISQYVDLAASPEVRSWRYKISATNDCDVEGPLSLRHKTIHIVFEENNGVFEINWDEYEGFSYPTFYLERRDAINTEWVQIGQGSSATYFSDTDNPIVTEGLDYRVSVESPEVCTAAKANDYNTSRSNRSAGTFNPGDVGDTLTTSINLTDNQPLKINVFPNPAKTDVYVNSEGSIIKEIVLLDVNGKTIRRDILSSKSKLINIESFSEGIYFIQVKTETGLSLHKLIKN